MDTILPREQYILIYRVSHILIITSLYAIYNKHYILFLDPVSIFFSSVLYWHKPDYSWRRYFDMVVVKSAILHQSILAYNSQYAIPYYCATFIALSCYPLGIYYYSKKDYWRSTYAHIGLHIIMNSASIILYSGYITPKIEPLPTPLIGPLLNNK